MIDAEKEARSNSVDAQVDLSLALCTCCNAHYST